MFSNGRFNGNVNVYRRSNCLYFLIFAYFTNVGIYSIFTKWSAMKSTPATSSYTTLPHSYHLHWYFLCLKQNFYVAVNLLKKLSLKKLFAKWTEPYVTVTCITPFFKSQTKKIVQHRPDLKSFLTPTLLLKKSHTDLKQKKKNKILYFFQTNRMSFTDEK
jgi:hypothetical protein